MAKDLSESIYDAFAALVAADTGAGGLSNSTGSQYVRKVIQRDDPNYDGRITVFPTLVVDVTAETEDYLFGSTYSSDRATAILRIQIVSKRDPKRAVQNAVNQRVREILSRVQLNSTDWACSKAVRLRGQQVQVTGTEYHYVTEYAIRARVGSVADAVGATATVSLTNTADTSGVTFTGEVIQSNLQRQYVGVQRARDITERWSPGVYTGTITVRGVLSTAASEIPPQPSGATVDVTITAFGTTAQTVTGVVEDSSYAPGSGVAGQTVVWRIRVGLFGDTVPPADNIADHSVVSA